MSEPPPSPLDTSAARRPKYQTSKSPYRPSLGSQNARLNSYGVRGNEPGGHAFPRSKRHTLRPAWASRYAITDPPNPEPTTTTWNFSMSPSACIRALGAGPDCCVLLLALGAAARELRART